MTNYTTRQVQQHTDVFSAQMKNLIAIGDSIGHKPNILFEEFPIGINNTLMYPRHYRMHTFYGEIGAIQVSDDVSFWLDPRGNLLSNHDTQVDLSQLLRPSQKILDELKHSAELISLHIGEPYMRIDLVISGRGSMLRSLACIPGDIRSNQHNHFYVQNDDYFDSMWESALKRIKDDNKDNNKDKSNADNSEPRSNIIPPDDNA